MIFMLTGIHNNLFTTLTNIIDLKLKNDADRKMKRKRNLSYCKTLKWSQQTTFLQW